MNEKNKDNEKNEDTQQNLDENSAEQTEQRTDDYDGLARRIDAALSGINDIKTLIKTVLDTIKISDNASNDTASEDNSSDVDSIDLETPLEDLDLNL